MFIPSCAQTHLLLMTTLRTATENDQPSILEIYNDAVLHLTATFDEEPRSIEKQMEWFRKHGKRHPVLVSEENGVITGWASLSPWSDRCAYDSTVEISVYIHKEYRGKGLGRKLLEAVIEEGKKADNHTVIARITTENEISIRLHEKLGFKSIGTMKEVGYKFGRFLDVHMMQLMY